MARMKPKTSTIVLIASCLIAFLVFTSQQRTDFSLNGAFKRIKEVEDDNIARIAILRRDLESKIKAQKDSLKAQKDTLILQRKRINDILLKSLPIGSVIAFDKEASYIPKGWVLCDGKRVTDSTSTYYKKTVPNLVDYFVRGKKNDENLRQKGGKDEIVGHNHSIADHKHTIDGHDHTFTTQRSRGGFYFKTIKYSSISETFLKPDEYVKWSNYSQKIAYFENNTDYDGYHTHSGTTDNSSWQYTSEAGGGQTGYSDNESNIPKYAALNYIIKIK